MWLADMNKTAFIETVRKAGIVGEGGAGFPAHVKYAAAADTLIANGCECEPLLRTDHHSMRHHGADIGRAMLALGDAVGASRRVLGLKKKHADLIARLRETLAAFSVELFLLDDFYPAGDEQILVREITGRSVPPLGIPLNVGALVANVGTLADVDAALRGIPLTDKTLTVTGEAGAPGIVRAPLGAPLTDCLAACGGALPANPVFVLGGPMMGRVVEGTDALAREPVTKLTGGLIVLPSGHPLHRNATLSLAVMRRRAASACIQCRACSDLCPRTCIGHPFETHRVMRAFAAGKELSEAGSQAALCCECGVCEQYACPMGMSPRRINQAVKAAMRGASMQYSGARELRESAAAAREFRKIPLPRLAARLGIAPYLAVPTPWRGELAPKRVDIPLRQHIGVPSAPAVRPGAMVRKGDCIGEIPEGALGARVHASIAGRVIAVGESVAIEHRADEPEPALASR